MRGLAAAVVVAGCIAGAAFAQDEQAQPDDGRFRAEWEIRGDIARYYPDAALERSVPGAVELCCVPRTDRGVDCRVAFEWPAGLGFGQASLRAVEHFRMTPASYAAFQANPDNFMQIPVRYRLAGMRREHARAMDRITEQTQGLCRSPGAPVS